VAAAAGERDDGDTPTTVSHSCCELDELALGSTDAVDGGNEIGDVHQALLPTIAQSMAAS